MKDYIYDIETYPNTFTFCAYDGDLNKYYIFEISDRKDQREQMISFLRTLYKNKSRMVGFNNIGFDYPVIHYILKNQSCSVYSIYKKAMSIIEASDDERFANLVRPDDIFIEQIDLYKIHHFDNRARSTSLKMIEFNSRSETIEDLPFPVGIDLTNAQKNILIEYNRHDVLKTYEFYLESKGKIEFRENLTKKYNRNFMNHNDTKIGKDYFVMRLEENNPQACYHYVGKRRVMKQTKRECINLKDCVFPYVKYERSEFNAILNWFKSQTIKETKGVFTDILESDLGEVAKYAEMVVKKKKLLTKPSAQYEEKLKKEKPSGWIEEVPLKTGKSSWYFMWRVAETLNVVVDGFRFDFGTGGIHGSISGASVYSNDSRIIKDADVASMYPNIAISNNVYPEHLGIGFCKIYKDVYEQRKTFAKGTDENATMKLALNGVYGDSNSEFSPFYDPMYTMKITINGQLSLCMLAEQLLKIDGLKLIQVNTDGVTVSMEKESEPEYLKVCEKWQKDVKLELEYADYKAMHIRDVNNYIALYNNGKVKRKGAYEYADLGYHQNQSMLVVPMAAEHALLGKGSVEDFILSHKDVYDFMLRVKLPRSNKLLSIDEFGVESQEQNMCRYYVSNNGVDLIKVMPALEGGKTIKVWKDVKTEKLIETDSQAKENTLAKRIEAGKLVFVEEYFKLNEERLQFIEAGYKCTVCNNMKDYKGDINYNYYIEQANKLVQSLTLLEIH